MIRFWVVCSGIANHFDFDPIYLRGAFAILFLYLEVVFYCTSCFG
ncbi:MAG: PspC domain-containing protein [Bacteroidetes bacterium]|nr:PspC domain-containing protein [Bacteroidota bacterium]